MIHNKKCIICLSTLDGEQPIIEQIELTTRIQYTHWQEITHKWHWQDNFYAIQ